MAPSLEPSPLPLLLPQPTSMDTVMAMAMNRQKTFFMCFMCVYLDFL